MDKLTIEKEKLREILADFPEKVDLEDFINQIIIVGKIEKAREQFENGEYLTEEELDKEIKKWS